MNSALRFRCRHPLDPMRAGFKFEPGIDPSSGNFGDDFLVAADFAWAFRNDFHLPTFVFGIARVHAKKIGGK